MQMKIMSYVCVPIECPKFRTLATPNADQDVEQHKLSFPAGGNAK